MEQEEQYEDNCHKEDFFCQKSVDRGCSNIIKTRFKAVLDMNKMSQQELSNKLSVDKAYISRISNGLQDPPNLMKIKIARALGVDSRVIWS